MIFKQLLYYLHDFLFYKYILLRVLKGNEVTRGVRKMIKGNHPISSRLTITDK